MPISISCQCGKSYNLKDEFAGRTVKCSNCGASLQVDRIQGSNVQERRQSLSDSVFNRDKFLLRQKVLTISEKYDVCDEQGNPLLYIERPAHFLRNLGAALAGVIAGITVAILLFMLVGVASESLTGVLILFALLSWFVMTFAVITLLYKKRDVTIYRDKSKQEPLLKVLQDKKVEILTATFTLRDTNGELAKFRKNYLYDFFRKHWHCYSPDGSLICVAKEDSIILALLRRFLLGTFFGLLRTNFIIVQGNSDRVIGEFNRKVTILDRYVLDMSADQRHSLDRRIAIALGVMLDTGERR
ncbi:hypothetical protein JOY44_29745 (plasmid) [Phormidium sp. CLA17]|uniref:hypothetical protein n=1 Tax=Leptolyngbya sp. Cla-17 TaxID=2803751 RepID=UPI0014925C67|nr:hypothetical protein [Leptolyngbya sp. Cla-17]MBM0745606.1 hypothetical protein [Leptolyngbya sp. Cla-17]